MAVNCCLAPTATLALDGATETDLSILGGVGVGGIALPLEHPEFAITSERKKKETGMESNQRRRMATYVVSPKKASAKNATCSVENRRDRSSATTSPTRRAARAETAFSCRILIEGCSAHADDQSTSSSPPPGRRGTQKAPEPTSGPVIRATVLLGGSLSWRQACKR